MQAREREVRKARNQNTEIRDTMPVQRGERRKGKGFRVQQTLGVQTAECSLSSSTPFIGIGGPTLTFELMLCTSQDNKHRKTKKRSTLTKKTNTQNAATNLEGKMSFGRGIASTSCGGGGSIGSPTR